MEALLLLGAADRGFLHERLSYASGTRNPSPLQSFGRSADDPKSGHAFYREMDDFAP